MEPSLLWSTLLGLAQRFPGLFPLLLLLSLAVPLAIWVVLLGSFRHRGHHSRFRFRRPVVGPVGRTGLFGRLRPRFSRLLLAGFRFPPLLFPFLPYLSSRLRALHDRMVFGFGAPLSLLILIFLTAYTIALAISLVFIHWQEFALVLQSKTYLHWDWSNPRAANRTDLEYRWWLKWFWRQSTLGQGYFRGFVRLGRGGPGPRRHLRWKRPPRNLGYWLGVWRYRTPFRAFKDRATRVRWFISRRHPLRLLRWLLGLVTGLLFLQGWALISVLIGVPAHLGRYARRLPRFGSVRGRQFSIELERLRDAARKANWMGLLLLFLSGVIFLGWPPLPVAGLSPRSRCPRSLPSANFSDPAGSTCAGIEAAPTPPSGGSGKPPHSAVKSPIFAPSHGNCPSPKF